MNKIHILHLISKFQGDYPLFNQVIFELDNTKYKHIICYLCKERKSQNILIDKGYEVIYLPFSSKQLRYFQPRILQFIRDIVHKYNINIIHAHRHKPTLYACIASVGLDIKVISTVHGLDRLRNFKRRIINNIMWRRLDKIITVSKAVRDDILQYKSLNHLKSKIEVIHNGIDTNFYSSVDISKEKAREILQLPKGTWLWGTIGRLEPVKAHNILINAWVTKKLYHGGKHLVIVGEGSLYNSLVKLSKDMNAKNITFYGTIKHSYIPLFLKAIDSFVFPSKKEGLPLALLEALSAGLPIVATAVGGIPEVLDPLKKYKGVILVNPDDPNQLSGAMYKIMSLNNKEYNLFQKKAKERALLFDKKTMIENLDKLYHNLLL